MTALGTGHWALGSLECYLPGFGLNCHCYWWGKAFNCKDHSAQKYFFTKSHTILEEIWLTEVLLVDFENKMFLFLARSLDIGSQC